MRNMIVKYPPIEWNTVFLVIHDVYRNRENNIKFTIKTLQGQTTNDCTRKMVKSAI